MWIHKRLLALPAVLLAALAVLALAPRGAEALDDGPWTVSVVQGEATATLPTRAPQALAVGDTIVPGSEIATGPDGQVTLTRGETRMTLSPDGRTQIPTNSDVGGRTTVFQRLGSLQLKVEKRTEQHFEVDTPFLAAVVKGTQFSVDVDAAGAAVSVTEGAVEVGALGSGQVQMVRPGQTASVGSAPNADLKLNQTGGQSDSGATGGATGGGNGAAQPAETASETRSAEAAPATPGQGRGRGLQITRTLGAESLDIASLTDGLVTPVPPRAVANGLGRGAAGQAAAGGKGRGKAAKADRFAGSVAGVAEAAPGQAGAVVAVSPGASGSTPAADVAASVSAVTTSVSDTSSAVSSAASGTVAGLGLGNDGTPPGLALGLGNGNGNGNGNSNGNGNGNGNGNSNGNGNGNGNGN